MKNTNNKSAKLDGETKQKVGDGLRSNKIRLNAKQKKKIIKWRMLKAFEIMQSKFFRPIDLEPKFSYIQDNNELILKDSDCQMIKPYMPELNAIEFFLNDIKYAYHERILRSR